MKVDLTKLGFLSSATSAFLNKEQKLIELIPESHPYYSVEESIKGKVNFDIGKRKVLVSTLKKQYKNIISEADIQVSNNIELLLKDNTFTVTTGQQLHLFLGPAFMVYKIISTIKAAEAYRRKFPKSNFVPIFWLASEDHDFDEIKNTPVFGENFEWKTNQKGAVGEYKLENIEELFLELENRFEKDLNTLNLINEFKVFYFNSDTLSQATIKMVHYCFKQYGIVCLDANNRDLKTFFKPIVKNELLGGNNKLIFDSFSKKLEMEGLSLQLSARPINLFYLTENLRSRIEKKGSEYIVLNTDIKFTESELLNLLENEPEKFSPNAVLRPIYQELILPNVAYIAGNAEVNYWLQTKDIFTSNNISSPTLILRQSAWFFSENIYQWLEEKGIDIIDLFKSESKNDFLFLLKSTEVNEFENLAMEFEKFKINIQNLTAKELGAELKLLVEGNKTYEKVLKNLVIKKRFFIEEKNGKNFKKLEQIKNQGLSNKMIQERTKYSLEFIIKSSNFIGISYKNIEFSPGYGYFLSI